jgi:hypothetical protein
MGVFFSWVKIIGLQCLTLKGFLDLYGAIDPRNCGKGYGERILGF